MFAQRSKGCALDLSTVERRGHQSAVREPVKRVRPHSLPEAPTFRPTEEEFKDPMEYIRKIAPEGKKYGICKIIPPDSWDPPFAIDTERFHFRTRRQELNSVEGDQLTKFHRQHGTTLARFPSVDKRPLDLYKLKKAVEVRGGFDQRWLQPYEDYLLLAKPGVQQQLEIEHGERSKSSEKPEKSEKSAPPPEPASIRPITVGFTAVNAPANGIPKTTSFVPINNGPSVVKKETDQGAESTTTQAPESGTVSKNSESRRVSAVNGHDSHPLKRALGNESAAGTPQAENGDDGANGRRSKRLKKDVAPTVSGSNMSLLRPTPPQSRPKGGNRKTGDKCETCGKSNDRPSILLCDGCDNGYHMHCLDPPLSNAPNYDWHCPKCLVGTGEYGFEEGGIYSLKQFQEKADAFKRNYFSGKMPFDPVLNAHRRETEDDVEREFWRLVESLTETVEVEYGADIHSTTHGSGFPTVERNPLDPYSVDPWNLNVLPLHGESLFRHIKSDVSGMTVPWVYVGMCFSTFCWHNEDHYSYSANYQHFGATKTCWLHFFRQIS
ncbi:histone demethylase JARID1C [Coccidioides immitis RMSCC 3703]|uniref:Histone demethylase JARID1C n=1 Tax=Coccidioides immitis RMSCC 3703 TaxID=454286 RepID=A0A0J8QQ43_COCIT|nr:histone demethylase JARID1C [Coccidioides immitis RMSCC 3703]